MPSSALRSTQRGSTRTGSPDGHPPWLMWFCNDHRARNWHTCTGTRPKNAYGLSRSSTDSTSSASLAATRPLRARHDHGARRRGQPRGGGGADQTDRASPTGPARHGPALLELDELHTYRASGRGRDAGSRLRDTSNISPHQCASAAGSLGLRRGARPALMLTELSRPLSL